MYVIGKTGVGKTTLMENMAIQDILSGEGVGIVDPHGEFAEKMLKFVPKIVFRMCSISPLTIWIGRSLSM